MLEFHIITIFPEIFESYLSESIIKRALKNKKIQITIHNLRDFSTGKHRQVDDRPYGGGPGMILMVEPIVKALKKITSRSKKKTRVIMLTPEGRLLTQKEGKRLSGYQRIILLCGRYEGFDARVEKYIDEKISIGPYVLAGGELPAMVVTEVIARHVEGVVGHPEALAEETFSKGENYVEYPQYTRPEVFAKQRIPKVLLSGNHMEIKRWREATAKKRK